MHSYILDQSRHGSVSEYIRSLVRRDRQRREDYASRPIPSLPRANDPPVLADALDQLDKLRTILERKDAYED